MGDGDPFFNYLFNSYNNENSSNNEENRFQNDWNAEQHYRYNENYNYVYSEGSGFGDVNNYDYGVGSGNNNDTGQDYTQETQNTQDDEVNREIPDEDGDGIDYSDQFVFEYVFKTFEEAFDRCDEVAYGLGFHLVKAKHNMERRPPHKLVKCERYGRHKSKAKDSENPQRKSMTQKCMCRFALKVIKRREDLWVVVPKFGLHNHHFGNYLEAHRRRARLTAEQKELIKQYRQSHVKPGMVRHAFTLRYPDQPAPILKQIYNENAKLSAKDRDGRNSVQHMLHLAKEANYLTEWMKNSLTEKLTHVWFSHPEGVQMFKAWPKVVLMDSTYKTNKYGHILVQCVGVTPVGKSFLIGYALIENESIDGYKWVLRRLESLLEPDVRPSVFVTDHEGGLLAALPEIFPTSYHFLCLWHVYTNVVTKATNIFKDGNLGEALAHGVWKKVVEAKTFEECNMQWNELKKKYCSHPILTDYLEKQWWHKIHMFAKCFTNMVLHFGNTTTSKVESAHAQLKMWFGSAILTYDNIWRRADVMIHGQHIEIRKTLEASISKTVVTNMYYGNIFSMLSGRVSAKAIEEMQVEYNRGTDLGYDLEERCGCTLWNTHQLYCACRLHRVFREGRRIHPDDLHVFWSRLTYTDSSHRRSRHADVMEEIFDKVRKSHHSVQRDVIEIVFAKLYPGDEVVEEPEVIERRRGRPRKSNTRNKSAFEHAKRSYPSGGTTSSDGGVDGPPLEINYNIGDFAYFAYGAFMPEASVDGFLGAFDPEGDGHCGFRVMSHAKTGNQRNYLEMRKVLLLELRDNVYVTNYYGERNAACRRITWSQHRPCLKPKWMEDLDLNGFATAFNWTICLLTVGINLHGDRVWTGSNTYLPLRPIPGVHAPYGIVWVLFTGNHFLRLRMNDDCAMPPITGLWYNYRHDDVAHYEAIYTERLDYWWQYVFSGEMFNPFT